MTELQTAFNEFSNNPTSEGLQSYATQLEIISRMLPPETVKTALIESITPILRNDRFEHVRRDPSMLRIYKILCRVSTKLGSAGIYEQLEKKGHFKSSLNFHLQWAEEHAKLRQLAPFQKVLDLARTRFADTLEILEIESGFRDIAEEYFPESVDHIFVAPDDTMILFTSRVVLDNGQRTKRRSSVCHLLLASSAQSSSDIPKGAQLRRACFETSLEEMRLATWSDTSGEIVKRRDSGIAPVLPNTSKKRPNLSTVCEKSMEDEKDKRSRVYSPVVPTKDAVRVPLRTVQTVTLSSDTNPTSAADVSLEDDKMREMASGRLDLLAEDKCLEARALFADTVVLDSDTTSVSTAKKSEMVLPNTTTDFSVLCDPDPTLIVAADDRPKKVSSGLNVLYDEEQKQDDLLEDDEEPSFSLPASHSNKIVTSTPAYGIAPVGLEEYFGNEENVAEKAPATFLAPKNSTINRLMRRKSQVPPIAPSKPVTAPITAPVVGLKNSSMDVLSENLGSCLSLSAATSEQNQLPETETTGIKNRRRSEVIRGELNPWDEDLRRNLMSIVRPPTNMHELNTRAPKIHASRDFEAGGEMFRIETLIGQGGYAKVYRARIEDGTTVAVKYEVPSCAWEVYICEQMRARAIRDARVPATWPDACIMRVMDAYIFSTASLLVNEYHEYGTLLEYVNNVKESSNWHVTCVLLSQMASVLREVHACRIIHADIKPDNFMITKKMDASWGRDALANRPDMLVIKLIDWGRAIDMMPLTERAFKGRAGTEGFDSPEMIDGRPWTYQTDYFGYAATMAVLTTGKYATLKGDTVGNYSLSVDIRRRNVLRPAIMEVIEKFLNIRSCQELPDWNETLEAFSAIWNSEFDLISWKQGVSKFNDSCDLVVANRDKTGI